MKKSTSFGSRHLCFKGGGGGSSSKGEYSKKSTSSVASKTSNAPYRPTTNHTFKEMMRKVAETASKAKMEKINNALGSAQVSYDSKRAWAAIKKAGTMGELKAIFQEKEFKKLQIPKELVSSMVAHKKQDFAH